VPQGSREQAGDETELESGVQPGVVSARLQAGDAARCGAVLGIARIAIAGDSRELVAPARVFVPRPIGASRCSENEQQSPLQHAHTPSLWQVQLPGAMAAGHRAPGRTNP